MITYIKKKQITWNLIEKVLNLCPDFIFRRIPDEIILEPTNHCNLRCPVCPTHFAMKRDRGFMDYELFVNIIDEFSKFKKKPIISMNFSGEPLINKDIYKFVEYAAQKGHQTYISTNVTTINEENARRLISAGLTTIHLCIDGFSKEAHETYRVGSEYEKIKENIEIFMKTKFEMGATNPHVTIQTLLTSLSENQQDAIEAWAKAIGVDAINFKSLSMGTYTTKVIKQQFSFLVPKQEKFRRKQSAIYRTMCRTPLRQSLVYWNGDLGLCCVDFDNVIKLPNIKENGYLNTLFSKEVIAIRKGGLRKQFGICKSCSLGNADYMGKSINFKANKSNLI